MKASSSAPDTLALAAGLALAVIGMCWVAWLGAGLLLSPRFWSWAWTWLRAKLGGHDTEQMLREAHDRAEWAKEHDGRPEDFDARALGRERLAQEEEAQRQAEREAGRRLTFQRYLAATGAYDADQGSETAEQEQARHERERLAAELAAERDRLLADVLPVALHPYVDRLERVRTQVTLGQRSDWYERHQHAGMGLEEGHQLALERPSLPLQDTIEHALEDF